MGRKKVRKSKEERLITQEKQFTKKWEESLVFRIYDLVKQGNSELKISKILGVDISTLRVWKEKKTYVRLAFEEGKAVRTCGEGKTAVETFQEYVFNNLSPDMQRTWSKITAYKDEENAVSRVEALLADKGENVRKHLFIHALVCNEFNISKACSLTNTSLSTVNNRWKKDIKFVQLLEEIEEHKKNFFESALLGLIRRGDSSAVIFANRTKNRDRGYSEKTTIEVTGSISHFHNIVSIEKLNLPVDIRREILEAMRAAKQLEAPDPLLNLPQAKQVRELIDA